VHPKRRQNPNAKRPTVKNRDLDGLIAAAWKAGWWAERMANNHVKCFSPTGGWIVPVPSTPSDHRTFRNKRGQFRRAGLNV
jgi:hypothetical protein